MYSHVERTLIDFSKFLPRLLPISALLFLTSALAFYSLAFFLNDGADNQQETLAGGEVTSFLASTDPHQERTVVTPQNLSPATLGVVARELEGCPSCLLTIDSQVFVNYLESVENRQASTFLVVVATFLPGEGNAQPGTAYIWGGEGTDFSLLGLENYETVHRGSSSGLGQDTVLVHPRSLTDMRFPPLAGSDSLPEKIACSCSADNLTDLAGKLNLAYSDEGLDRRFYAYSDDSQPYTVEDWAVSLDANQPFFLPLLVLLLLAVAANAMLWGLLHPSYRLQAFYGAHWAVLFARYLIFVGVSFVLPLYLGFVAIDAMLRTGGGYSAPPWQAGGGAFMPLALLALLLLVAAPGVRAIYRLSRKELTGD